MYHELKKIRGIEPEAAKYIEAEVIPRYSKERIIKAMDRCPGMTILDFFIWEQSPQGRDYWFNVWGKLQGVKNESSGNLEEIKPWH